jgi:hypothetical protein
MRLYRLLLHLYPAGFRAEYAEVLSCIVPGYPRVTAAIS